MNHLKIFENQNTNRFFKFIQEKVQFLNDIDEYFNDLNPDFMYDNEKIDSSDIDYFEGAGIKEIEIFYCDNEGENQTIVLKDQDAEDLIEFINNTEMYRNAKKYNL